MATETITWIGIALLVAQSGIFSGLNLALFGVSALRLRTMANMGNEQQSPRIPTLVMDDQKRKS